MFADSLLFSGLDRSLLAAACALVVGIAFWSACFPTQMDRLDRRMFDRVDVRLGTGLAWLAASLVVVAAPSLLVAWTAFAVLGLLLGTLARTLWELDRSVRFETRVSARPVRRPVPHQPAGSVCLHRPPAGRYGARRRHPSSGSVDRMAA